MNYQLYKNNIWRTCLETFKAAVLKGVQFAESGKCSEYRNNMFAREELATGSRYMHRGFYCPSPLIDQITVNFCRGRILKRPTKKSNISHRYVYDSTNRLIFVEYMASSGSVGYEHIVYADNVVYGFVFNTAKILCGISVETYCENKIQSYMWAICHNASATIADHNWQADYVRYETYTYEDDCIRDVDLHLVALLEDEFYATQSANNLVDHKKYVSVQGSQGDGFA